MIDPDNIDLLAYLRGHRLAVVATVAADGAPQAALVGVATTDALEVVFDTLSTGRKHANLSQDARACVTFSGPREQTLQFQGVATPVSLACEHDQAYREAYYAAWPDGRDRLSWANLVYWRLSPLWLRFSDFGRGPLVVERQWPAP